jgi:amino acid transporter
MLYFRRDIETKSIGALVVSTQEVADPAEQVVEFVNVEGRASTQLRRGALGLPALFFCIATAAAPLTALLFNVPVIVSGAGWAAPAAFIVATVTLLIFSVGYVEISRRLTSAGGFYSFVSHGFGQAAGLGTAAVVASAYPILAAAIIGVFAYFANTGIDYWFGVNIPVWILLFGVILVDLAFLYFDISITARVLGTFFLAEIIGALVFSVAVLVSGGHDGLSAAPLNPLNLFHNHSAISVFGAAAPGIALFGAFWSWVGFEMAPNYGEESREPHQIFGRATFGTLLVLGVIYVLVTYAFVIGYGTGHVAQGVKAQFAGTTVSAFYPLLGHYGGSFLTNAFRLLIITSAFACQLAFFNTSARYLFALGREGILPRALGRTHERHQTPHIAGVVIAGFLALFILGFYIDDSSTLATLTKLATWAPLVGVLGILAIQALVSFAIVRYFWVFDRAHRHWWKTVVAPLLGGALQVFSAYLLVDNRETLAGADVPFVQAVPWIVLAIFALGVGAALWFRFRDSVRYQAVGRFVHEEA